MEFSAQQIASLIGGHIEGDAETIVTDVAKIEEGKAGSLSFLANPKYSEYLYTSNASIIIINKDFQLKDKVKTTLIRVDDAYEAFAKLLDIYTQLSNQKQGISPKANIESSAIIGENVYVGAGAYIGENTRIGDNALIYPNTYLGDKVTIGQNSILYANVSINHNCEIGENCILHSGVVVGSDGFGFAPNAEGGYKKIPQIGKVIVENDVEIGANTTIDRATMGATIIRQGVKLDNLIQVAHNVEIGRHTVIAAQTGIAGSVKIGEKCMIGGQVGFAGHIKIADNTKIGAQSGVMKTIEEKSSVVQGSPAVPFRDFFKSQAVFMRLPELDKTINKLIDTEKK